ncbi:MAG: hypothetical protein Q8L65_00545 [Burkholderiales bacterium]|nr:hypothetical protein [Burkholderiales bacterium]MDP2399462.1 hypothetical protein [Burkholderiales bacterium]
MKRMNASRVVTGALGERRKHPARRETIAVLVEHLSLAQRTGQWLANETHGDAYSSVRELNEHLHQAQCKLRAIQNNLPLLVEQAADGANSRSTLTGT